MDKFQYVILQNEMATLTTKTAKTKFVKKVKSYVPPRWSTRVVTPYTMCMLQEIWNVWELSGITGVASIPALMSSSIHTMEMTSENIALLPVFTYTPSHTSNAHLYFMASAGVPVQYKLAVLKVEAGIV